MDKNIKFNDMKMSFEFTRSFAILSKIMIMIIPITVIELSPVNKLDSFFINGNLVISKVYFSKNIKMYIAIKERVRVVHPYQSPPGF